MKVTVNDTNVFGMPLLSFPKIGLPGVIGDLADQGFSHARAASGRMTEVLGETYSCNARGAADYALKVIEISHANAASALDFFAHLLGSKSAADVLTLSTEQARKAFDTASDQNRELWALGQKLAAETSEPVRKHFAKVLHQAG
ncbi:phasin family protein [Bradyrhizobium sp. 2S1]|uniref:phasin family protein n=1 Tax=Bradyrhizobium sp. 2S1 TaxID=1404429 RepID=UPI001CD1126E|nr:phasin family protein [Bradyrhizobium sp. 2S1]MCK7671551.1 phasin family protein [Bradyrhizobium sp. 2S1]